MPTIRILVSVKSEKIKQLREVAESLESAGMHIHQLLDEIGLITGSVDFKQMAALQEVEGVSHIDQEQEYEAL